MPTTAADRAVPFRFRILVVDDEPRIRNMLTMCLEDDGHDVTTVSDAAGTTAAMEKEAFDIVFLDLRLPDRPGMALIPELLAEQPRAEIVIITAHASIDSAVKAMRKGASDYLPKPFSPAQVRLAVQKAAEVLALEQQVETLEADLAQAQPGDYWDTRSDRMKQVLSLARRAADSEAVLLLRGESGTGKGVLARHVHAWSPRANGPFVVAHSPSLSGELFESELFGHVKGAFTGAVRTRTGRVAQAEGGTLLLDEIGDLPLALQPKLLRFIQSHEYERVGDPETRQANVRLLAATNQNLEAAVEEGRFREDLFYRLNVIEVTLPSLRARQEDILPLARQFLGFFSGRYNRPLEGYTEEAERALHQHPWRGNVRELRNAVERAAILCSGTRVQVEHLPFQHTAGEAASNNAVSSDAAAPDVGSMTSLAELEEAHIRRIVAATETLEEAAQTLGIDPATLWRRRKKYGI